MEEVVEDFIDSDLPNICVVEHGSVSNDLKAVVELAVTQDFDRCFDAINADVVLTVCAAPTTSKVAALLTPNVQPHASHILAYVQAEPDTLVSAYEAGFTDCISLAHHHDIINRKLLAWARAALGSRIKATQTLRIEDMLSRVRQEEDFAQHVYTEITGGATREDKDYFTLQQSASGFCGDFFFEMNSPTGIRYMFLADAMGHGLAAALTMMPVINVVKAMAHRSMPLTTILQEVNRRLNTELPDDRFVSLMAMELSPFSNKISIVNAGLPPIFVMDKGGELRECASHCIPLGIMQGSAFSFEPYVYDLSSLHSLITYTDGLIEQENKSGQCIAQTGLKSHLAELYQLGRSWRGIADLFLSHRGDTVLSDDVTLCVLDFDYLGFDSDAGASLNDDREGDVEFVLSIKGDYLKQVDAPAFVSKFLYAAGIEGKMAGKTFTALAELYQNGLDHGVLALSSELKNDIEGFAAYMEQREQRMNSLAADDEVQLKIRYSADGGVVATVIDSGAGYDTNRHTNSDEALHGRGLTLVKQLTESFDTNRDGNQVQIVIKE